MPNKKSKKFIKIMLSAMMILCIGSNTSYADGTSEYGKNGISYVLLNSEFSHPGVYRFNDGAGNVATPWKVFSILDMTSSKRKTSGLAVNQNNKVFLLSSTTGGDFSEAPVGWLPKGIKFPDNSPIYVTAILPSEGATDYKRSGRPHGSTYWKSNETLDNKTYKYAVKFGGPDGVKFLNGVDGEEGTPMWDGTYSDESNTNASAIKHPTDWDGPKGHKIILRSHFGAVGYYLYGTSNLAGCEGLPMDGTDNRDEYIYSDANKYGNYNRGGIDDSRHNKKDEMFECVIKRIYQRRINSLDLYDKIDSSNGDSSYPVESMTKREEDVLKTTDVQVKEYYGKYCGDNCIPGGEMPGGEIGSVLSTVTVVTATTGNRYGFNPMGEPNGTGSEASLRVVKNGITSPINIANSTGLSLNTSNITNYAYLGNIKPDAIKTIGVSSKSDSDNGWDYIYGSCADYFVVQDSWWGKGGIAYEYYKGDSENPGKIVKIDYTNDPGRTASETLGDLEGNVDAIAIDGDGYLYALKTEESPSDEKMKNISAIPNDSKVTVDGQELEITYSGWRRDNSTTTDDETINAGFDEISDGSQEEGDYRLAKVQQKVFKNIKRYPQGTGSLGTEEDRGGLEVGFDTWYNKLKKTSYGYNWEYGDNWREEKGTKTSSILAELAVVNVADSPKTFPGTKVLQTIVACDSNFKTQIKEDEPITFKIEGFRPYIDGAEKNLIDMGIVKIKNQEHHLLLNTIPAKDGTYEHDENGDNKKSGFPSNMFETDKKRTKVTWTIEYVENTSVEDYINNPKIIESQTNISSNDGNNEQKLIHKFENPGRYIVKASVVYNLFTNFGTAKNPNELEMGTEEVEAEPTLITVTAKNLLLDKTPSYITNIALGFDNRHIGLEDTNKEDDENLTNKEKETIGSITINFDAQFYRISNNKDENKNYIVHDGIGVWDYEYYSRLYQKANDIASIEVTIPSFPMDNHVYNYGEGSVDDLENSYNKDVYNPGREKVTKTNGYSAEAGTLVEGKPNKKDMAFIQWAIYLRKTDKPEEDVPVLEGLTHDLERGELIAKGTFEDANFTQIGDESLRKYNVSYEIPKEKIIKEIKTPRDPKDYTLDLEIIYPRVTWLRNDLTEKSNQNNINAMYGSVVPYCEHTPGEQDAGPIHVISMLNTVPKDKIINQNSSKSGDDFTDLYKDQNPPIIKLCVRDDTKPESKDTTKKEKEGKVLLPRTETTGDSSDSFTFEYKITDNNPFLSDEKYDKKTISSIDKDKALKIPVIAMQTWDDESKVRYGIKEDGRKYIERNKYANEIVVASSTTGNNKGYYFDDKWRINLDYTFSFENLCPFSESKSSSENSIIINNLTPYDSWVGELDYAIIGQVYDGKGKDKKREKEKNGQLHYFYNKKVYDDLNKKVDEDGDKIEVETSTYINRIDNDPPSIEVELISQNDNRRWIFQLLEAINDKVCYPQNESGLNDSILNIKNVYLRNENLADQTEKTVDGFVDPGPVKIAGCSNNPPIGNPKVEIEKIDKTKNIIPTFRRASRLLINVNIIDNCGYYKLDKEGTKIVVNDKQNGDLLIKEINPEVSHGADGNIINFSKKPRGVFTVNLPMQVAPEENQPQITISVKAKDHAGNERELVIPVKLIESSFETRVLETKEERK